MNLECDVRLEYSASERSGHRWREGVELSIAKDDWNHNVLVIGAKSKKSTFQLEKNIRKIHTSYIDEGMITISLSSPILNVFIRKAVVENLRAFTRLLSHVQKHPHDDLEEVAEKWGMQVKRKAVSDSESSSEDPVGEEE